MKLSINKMLKTIKNIIVISLRLLFRKITRRF